jgi:hypothetical protein
MKNLGKLSLGVIISSLLFISCEKEDAVLAQAAVTNMARAPRLMGKWESECKDSKIVSKSMKEFYKFSGSTLAQQTEYYSNGNCENPAVQVQYDGNVKVDEKNPAVEDAHNLTFNYKTVAVKPLNEEGVKLLKMVNFCGKQDWKVNEKQVLTGQSTNLLCPVAKVPQTYYEVAKIDHKDLFLGAHEAGGWFESAGQRPSALDWHAPFIGSHHRFMTE